jgi:competence protein ComEA
MVHPDRARAPERQGARGGLARLLERSAELRRSPWVRPALRAVACAAGLVVFTCIGLHAGRPDVPLASAADPASSAAYAEPPSPVPAAAAPATDAGPPPSAPASTPLPPRATPESPVILNTATADDLVRLPGVGPKRAQAILELRSRLGGRFRTVDDLRRVKGVGRAMMKRLRPLVRLDAPVADAGPG